MGDISAKLLTIFALPGSRELVCCAITIGLQMQATQCHFFELHPLSMSPSNFDTAEVRWSGDISAQLRGCGTTD